MSQHVESSAVAVEQNNNDLPVYVIAGNCRENVTLVTTATSYMLFDCTPGKYLLRVPGQHD